MLGSRRVDNLYGAMRGLRVAVADGHLQNTAVDVMPWKNVPR